MENKKRIINGVAKIKPGGRSLESLSHFWCASCTKWWSIGDAPLRKHEWFCPWCGTHNHFKRRK